MVLVSLLGLPSLRVPTAEAQTPRPLTENEADTVAYGDSDAVNASAIWELDTATNYWTHASPAAPNADMVIHESTARVVSGMSPPDRGVFWFPQYHGGKVLIAHFSGCFNDSLPETGGCKTQSQSIGEFSIDSKSYRWLEIGEATTDGSGALQNTNRVQGSVFDIEVNPRNGKLYYIGDPNFIGYLPRVNDPRGGYTWNRSGGKHLHRLFVNHLTQGCTFRPFIKVNPYYGYFDTRSDACLDSTAIGNEIAILPTDDVVVTNWLHGKILIFGPELDLRAVYELPESHYWPVNGRWAKFLRPLSVEASPRCLRPQGNGCTLARFVINYDAFPENEHRPFREFVWDSAARVIAPASERPVVVKTWVLKTDPNDPKRDQYDWLDGVNFGGTAGSVRGIKYDSDGNLWVASFDHREPHLKKRPSVYDPAEVMVFVPKIDPGGWGGQRFPWEPSEAPGTGSNIQCNLSTAWNENRQFGNYFVCRPDLQDGNKYAFLSSGRFVASIIQAGKDIYWGGWGGSFEGVLRVNPGQWPPVFREVEGQPDSTKPGLVWRSNKRLGDPCFRQGQRLGPVALHDSYVTVDCTSQDETKQRGALAIPGGNIGGVPARDQQVHMVFDPDRSAVWVTIQGVLECGHQNPDETNQPACPSSFKAPQWLLRHNVYAHPPSIINPTGSVAGVPGQKVWVGADVYSTRPPSVMIETRTSSGQVTIVPAEVIAPEAGQGPYKIRAALTVPQDGSILQYRIRAQNTGGTTILPPPGSDPAYFDVGPTATRALEFHFAEGRIDPNFETWLVVTNPHDTQTAQVRITYRPPAGDQPVVKNFSIPPGGRLTRRAKDDVPQAWSAGKDLGISVQSTNGVKVVAERPMYFSSAADLGFLSGLPPDQVMVSGAHNAMGATSPSRTWRFAEGYFRVSRGVPQDNWSVWLTLSNPGSTPANATVTLFPNIPGHVKPKATLVVAPGARQTLAVNQELLKPQLGQVGAFRQTAEGVTCPQLGCSFPNPTEYSMAVESDQPIIAERPTYFISSLAGGIRGGDVALGVMGARKRWIFAEGAVAKDGPFDTFLTLANMEAQQAQVLVTYRTNATSPITKPYKVAPGSRYTIWVDQELRGLIGPQVTDVSLEVRSDVSLVAERPAYFSGSLGMAPGSSAAGGHVGFGSTTPRTEWNFAEGFRSEQGCPFNPGQGAPAPPDSIQYLTLSNPGPSDAQVRVWFLPEPGVLQGGQQPPSLDVVVPAGTRQTIAPHNYLGSGQTQGFCGKGYGMRVRSLALGSGAAQPIVAERPLYWNRQVASVFANGGHIVLPMHNLGIAPDPAVGLSRALADTPVTYSQIDPSSGTQPREDIAIVDFVDDITATVGQGLQVEATTRGRPTAVTLFFTPEGSSSPQRIQMQEVRPDFWRADLSASQPGFMQALAEKNTTYSLSWVSRLSILEGPAISGRVSGETPREGETTPVAGVEVKAFDASGQVGLTYTQKDGYYAMALPAPGPYRLSFLPQNTSGRDEGFADSYTIHSLSYQAWDAIDVPPEGTVYDEVLKRAGRFYGRVTGGETPSQISYAANKVAFTSRRDGNNEIYVMDADGSNLRRLTNSPADDIWPAFSPDGRQIAFASSRDGNFELYLMNADGTNLRRLTSHPALDNQPAWSPDGNTIAFVSDRDGNQEIYLIRLDQTSPTRLTYGPDEKRKPEWSPDSAWIIYVSGSAIWRIRPDGTQATQISEGLMDYSPAVSPDGRKIAFTSLRDGDEEIYVMEISPTGPARKLTDNQARDTGAAYSLDGDRIFFLSDRHDPGGALEIYQMSSEGADQQKITTGAEVRTAPDTGPNPSLEVPLQDVSVDLFDEQTNKTVGRSVFTGPDGTWEKWVPPGRYYGLVNSATQARPLGWNGYSLAWSKGQIFDRENGGMITVFELTQPPSSVRYDETLKRTNPVSGRVVPQGGPGLGAGGAVGSFRAISPNGQFAAVPLPPDGNYVYPLPKGAWKIVYVVPGYRTSYYHDTEDFSQATEIQVTGQPIQLLDQHIYPSP